MGKTNIDEIFFGESIDADAIRAKMTCYSASDDAHDVVGQRHQVSRPDKAANKKLELAAKTTATQLLHTYATEAENLGISARSMCKSVWLSVTQTIDFAQY